ncbi:MAG: acetylxylan esterase, partial [Armatimonadota bacterium]
MPLIDMPLDQLKSYQGRNPKPNDFELYWDRSLDEMRSIDPRVELVPYEMQARNIECFHLFFTGVGGARIHAKYLRPKNVPEPHPAILFFHGYSGNSGDWLSYFGWASQGFCVAALEPRINRVASTYPFLCDYQRVWEMDYAKAAYEELVMYFRLFDPRHE